MRDQVPHRAWPSSNFGRSGPLFELPSLVAVLRTASAARSISMEVSVVGPFKRNRVKEPRRFVQARTATPMNGKGVISSAPDLPHLVQAAFPLGRRTSLELQVSSRSPLRARVAVVQGRWSPCHRTYFVRAVVILSILLRESCDGTLVPIHATALRFAVLASLIGPRSSNFANSPLPAVCCCIRSSSQ